MVKFSYELASNRCAHPVTDLKQITKQMSQLIAKSWLPGGEEIREILLSKDDKKILKMFKDNGINVDILGAQEVRVDWNTFLGSLQDTTEPDNLELVIGYPPRPSEFNLTDADLEEWVNNDDPQQTVPTHPYIPVTF